MDTVILAAGYGRRLAGYVPQYHKPLMIWKGAPIIKTAVESAAKATTSDRIIVVVSPHNATAVCEVLSHVESAVKGRLQYVIQPEPTGPGDALLRGLYAADSQRVFVLMGDNFTSLADMREIAGNGGPAIGIQVVPAVEENERFTRSRGPGWVEKQPIRSYDDVVNGHIEIWNGPLVVKRDDAVRTLKHAVLRAVRNETECPIGQYLAEICPNAHRITVDTVDVGIPSMIGSDA